jgi:hypothetical protein
MKTPISARFALDEQAAQDRAQEAEYRDLRGKAILSLGAASLGMLVSMPLMGGTSGGPSHGHVTDTTSWVFLSRQACCTRWPASS